MRTRKKIIVAFIAIASSTAAVAGAQQGPGAPSVVAQILDGLTIIEVNTYDVNDDATEAEASVDSTQDAIATIELHEPTLTTRCEGPVPNRPTMAVARICTPENSTNCTEIAYDCAPQLCVDGRCGPPSCAGNIHCAPTAECDLVTGACVAHVYTRQCHGEYEVIDAAGNSTSCAPYKCLGGRCRPECLTTTDCASGYECRDQKCGRIQPPSDGDTEVTIEYCTFGACL